LVKAGEREQGRARRAAGEARYHHRWCVTRTLPFPVARHSSASSRLIP